MLSLVAHTKPFTALAASRLLWLVANACHIHVNRMNTENTRLTARRPKMLERGTMMKFAKPSVMTVIPVNMANWLLFKWNCAPSSGNMGAMDKAPVTEIHVKSHCEAITITVTF